MSLRDKLKTIARALGFAARELKRLPSDAKAHATYAMTEEQMTTQRLARRYDPSMALNESYGRARKAVEAGSLPQAEPTTPKSSDDVINRHYEELRRRPPQLTANQEAALKVQQQTLQRNLSSPVRRGDGPTVRVTGMLGEDLKHAHLAGSEPPLKKDNA